MLSLQPEVEALRIDGVLGEASASRMIALERRELFSLHYELRAMIYGGLLLIVGGVGILIRTNVDRIGPAVLIAAIAVASAICYAIPFFSRHSAKLPDSRVFLEYSLLLGALLASADLGYAVNQYAIFGENWRLQFLILAVFHSVTAYLFSSRSLLAVAITALASWLGLSDSGLTTWLDGGSGGADLAGRGLFCALLILIWRQLHARLSSVGDFLPVFSHFIANVALLASLAMITDSNREIPGLILLLLFSGLAVVYGLRTGRETFVIYGVAYGLLGVDFFVLDRRVHTAALVAGWLLISTAAAAFALFRFHRSFRSDL
ncbi:MAG: DUF2157 domain-containing protein [Acidobacteriota bacterium]